ncbi:MAG: hypothetical protein M3Q27_12450, partial [Actinomycetota bacterium]|nr:hypothetical protein [Actinomycetota bacterium]
MSVGGAVTAVAWDTAWRRALYGSGGFARRAEGPAAHFRTSVTAGAPVLADVLLDRLAAALGHPD